MKEFRGDAASLMGHLIAHDGHKHGKVGIILNQLGHPLDGEVAYGIWDWQRSREVWPDGGDLSNTGSRGYFERVY